MKRRIFTLAALKTSAKAVVGGDLFTRISRASAELTPSSHGADGATGVELSNAGYFPVGNIPGQWRLLHDFSDEFDGASIDLAKWKTDVGSWGSWSWDAKNVSQDGGQLRIRMRYEPHTVRGKNFFYKSGILRSQKEITYGYFEARIKGCALYPGACPAFWLYSVGRRQGDLRYSEIDIVEMLQAHDRTPIPNRIDCNLHCRVADGKGGETWIRPQQAPDLCRHNWKAPWDPRDDFHVYGCENRPDAIIWYVDGQKVASAENRYWRLPMRVTLSLGLRAPYERYVKGERSPAPEKSSANGFPTDMLVDYVRVWEGRLDARGTSQ